MRHCYTSIPLLTIISDITPFNKITAIFRRGKKSGDREPMSHAGGSKHCCCLTITGKKKRAKDCASYLKVGHTQPDTEVVLLYSSTPAGETSLGHRETEGLGESGSIVPGPDSQAGEVLAVGGPLHR